MARKRGGGESAASGRRSGSGERGRRPGPAERGRKIGASEREPQAEADEPRRPKPWSGPWLLEWAKTLAFALLIFLVLRTFIVESFVISSGSMEETLLVGDFLLVNKTVFGSPVPGTPWRVPGYGEPRRGEVIVFRADHAPGLDLVKRVVGLPGDTLEMRDGRLFVNGRAQEEPYARRDPRVPDAHDPAMGWQRPHLVASANGEEYRPTRDDWGPLEVPPERYFMLGDNREHSLDSRYWGLVEREKLKGKPFFVYYSYDRSVLKPFPWVTAVRPGRMGPFP